MIPSEYKISDTRYYIRNEMGFFSQTNVHFVENIAFIDLW